MSKAQEPEIKEKGGDLEAGAGGGGGGPASAGKGAAADAVLYPKMTEDPRLRWGFIRKVYAILAAQFVFTSGVAAAVSYVRPVPAFILSNTAASWTVFVAVLLSPFLALWPMLRYRERHPINLVLLAVFTFCISLAVGLACVTVSGKVVLQAAVLTASVVVGLTLYTFWAARRGHDFAILYPFLFACLLVLIVYAIMQVCFPLGRIGSTIYGCVATLIFSGFIVYDTDRLIKRHQYSEYIEAAISLYLDVINLFMATLTFSSVQ
ncbi:BI1-like protein isoform X2 [Ananas comosus]|uniref:BI1-like protein isoform X1 n=1 Tax=Ananas comosus TaxID=4615 RepID=A0A6P5G8H5_ANACO|nr:BI1-like protein isoform X1 [Ananas comosus]XP_020104913.1 BI1-like protein isoform X2 [Ananas comosus]